MKYLALIALLTFAGALDAGPLRRVLPAKGCPTCQPIIVAPDLHVAKAVLHRVNEARARLKLPKLRLCERLSGLAMGHSIRQAMRGCHHSGLPYCENVAAGHTDADEVVNAWMASPGHRANILNARDAIGVGMVNGYWTMLME